MKIFTKVLSGIGFVSMLLGMGSMDSSSVAIPIALIFLGLGMFAFGGYLSDFFYLDDRK